MHFFSNFSEIKLESEKGREGGGVAEAGGEGVGHISVKIILTAFCMLFACI